MAYEVVISDGSTDYVLPAPAHPDGYQENITYNAASRVLANNTVAVQVLAVNQAVYIFEFAWVAINSTQLGTIMSAFDAVSRANSCLMTTPTAVVYTVTTDPNQKALRKRIYKARGGLVFDVSWTLRAVW